MAATWVSGLALSGGLYREVIRPPLNGVPHSAGLLGWGSDALGFDTDRSTDHGWGPRLLVFVDRSADSASLAAAVDAGLPETYAGWPVRFGWDGVPVRHWVTVTTLADWLQEHLGVDASAGWSTLDWLVTPQQRLLRSRSRCRVRR